jgi:hypothetical protein
MSKANKVEVQKGKIIGNPPTMKQMTYPEKVREQKEENALRRHGQRTDLHEPNSRRK